MPKTAVEMEVALATMELPDVKTLRLAWPAGHAPEFQTGQFITLSFPDTPGYRRAYSLSSSALDRGSYEVTVKRDGKMGTRLVDWAQAGHRLLVLPPAGRFLPVFDPPDRHLVCLAGGSGVTPFRGFVREATARGLATRITVLYSVRTTADIIFQQEFRALEERNPRFQFAVTCTRLGADDPWPGRRGRLDAAWVRGLVPDPAAACFYACGPNALVEAAEHLVLHDLGVPKERMRTEKWG
jgi:ferredoxin-NADP reductase